MSLKEKYFDVIVKEMATGRAAMESGNDGRVRVCARRAAGQAITWFMTSHPRPWPADAMMQLKHFAGDETFPQEARDAAARLTTKISQQFTYQFSTDPLADARSIIAAIERQMEQGNG